MFLVNDLFVDKEQNRTEHSYERIRYKYHWRD